VAPFAFEGVQLKPLGGYNRPTMIDPRKPLEGVPGLLLMAALVLFGATIGIAKSGA
jgi:hypothetical protein